MNSNKIATINKFKEYDFIIQNILSQLSTSKKIKLQLIYKSSKDGMNADSFHKFCNGKGPTVSIIKTTKNIRFGGFLNIKWKSEGGDAYDIKSFLFSLNKMKVYKNNGNPACVFERYRGPYFAYSINIFNNFLESSKHRVRTLEDMKNGWINVISNFELNEGEEYFNIEEIEVFEVLFD